MDVLVVGAGALGKTYGGHLARAGHRVTFLVRSARPDATVRLRGVRPRRSFDVAARHVTRVEDAPAPPHVALLCVPSDPLDVGLLDRLAEGLGPACPLVSFTPGFADPDIVVDRVGARRALFALPSMSAMEDAGELRFWLPPAGPTRVGPHPAHRGEHAALEELGQAFARALDESGMPAVWDPDTVAVNHATTAAYAPLGVLFRARPGDLAAALADDALLARVCAATRETAAVAREVWGDAHAPTLGPHLFRPALLRAVFGALRRLDPALWRFLETHFTKIDAQNAVMLRELTAIARSVGRATPAFDALVASDAPAR